ncbi:MAG: thioredoxin [Candidatus Omnitrophica bacterium]|nr:thioredoxin [Candidatus Omnitrophota bacterium]
MSEASVTVTQANFQTEVLQSKTLVIVDFWASWCAPCRAIAPVLDELALAYKGKLTVGKVNVDEYPDLAAQFGILNIPTLIFVKEGKEVDRVVGVQPKNALEEKIKKLSG